MENVLRLDLHALIPRFAPLRLHDPVRLARLVASIERRGQLMPVVAVPAAERAGQWVLIDGYRRRAALARLKQDRIWVDVRCRPWKAKAVRGRRRARTDCRSRGSWPKPSEICSRCRTCRSLLRRSSATKPRCVRYLSTPWATIGRSMTVWRRCRERHRTV